MPRLGVFVRSPSRFEIFQKLPDKRATWVETGDTLEEATKRLKELAVMFPADYFIFDTENACFVVPCDLARFEPLGKQAG
jgi:hypothetical protein